MNSTAKPKKIVIVAHMPKENGGSFLPLMMQRGFDTKLIKAYKGEPIPSPAEYDGLVVMGGLVSVNSKKNFIQEELKVISQVLESNKPYFGICFGLQALVKTAGGDVVRSSHKEIGFKDSYTLRESKPYTLKLTADGKKDALFKGIKGESISPIFQLHRATVRLNPAMTYPVSVLATDRDGIVPNQVVKVGEKAYGIQCHRELTREVLLLWLTQYAPIGQYSTEMKWEIIREYDRYEEEYTRVSNKIFNNFLDLV